MIMDEGGLDGFSTSIALQNGKKIFGVAHFALL
jgi:hypothetical protein